MRTRMMILMLPIEASLAIPFRSWRKSPLELLPPDKSRQWLFQFLDHLLLPVFVCLVVVVVTATWNEKNEMGK
jgi:hypothetical protein